MALASIAGKPGTGSGFTATPTEIFYGTRPQSPDGFIPGPVTVDGTNSSAPSNTPYVWLLRAGTLMGKITASGLYRSSVIGRTTAAYTSGGTSLTVGAATATEVARLITAAGGNVSLKLVGPPTAAGTVAVTSVTASAASGTTITVSNLGVNVVTDSLLTPADGSQTPTTVVCDLYGLKVIDAVNTTRVDVYDAELFAGKGIIDEARLIDWPGDTSTQAWIKAGLRTNFPGAVFKGDIING